MKIIPIIQGTSSFKATITLSDVVYQIRIRWNTRDEAWYLDLYDTAGVAILLGLKLVLNWDTQARYVGKALPSGWIIPVDVAGDQTRITRTNLGDTVQLMYLTQEEIDAIV